jgi:hypothetical protein
MHTTMGRLSRAEDGRLAWLPHIGSLCLSGKQERVRVSIGRVVDGVANEGHNAGEDQGRVDVPARQQVRNSTVELVEETRHVVVDRSVRVVQSVSWAEQTVGELTVMVA